MRTSYVSPPGLLGHRVCGDCAGGDTIVQGLLSVAHESQVLIGYCDKPGCGRNGRASGYRAIAPKWRRNPLRGCILTIECGRVANTEKGGQVPVPPSYLRVCDQSRGETGGCPGMERDTDGDSRSQSVWNDTAWFGGEIRVGRVDAGDRGGMATDG